MGRRRASQEPPSAQQLAPEAAESDEKPVELDRPRKKLTPEQFFQASSGYADSGATATYVYRIWPRIDKKLSDEDAKTYIDKCLEPIDASYLLRTWGSGEYSLRFTDENKPRGHTEICRTVVKLHDPEFPPVLDLRELVIGDPANKSYVEGLRVRGLLPREGEEVVPAKQDSGPLQAVAAEVIRESMRPKKPEVSDAVHTKMLDVMAAASSRAVEIATANARPVDPIEQALKLKELFKGNTGDAAILKLLMDSQAKYNELLLRMMESRQQPAGLKGSVKLLNEMHDLMEKFGFGDRRDSGALDKLIGLLPGILTPLASMLNAWASTRLSGMPQPQTGAASLPAPELAGAPAMPMPPTSGAPDFNPSEPSMPIAIPPAAVQQLGAKIIDCLDRGIPGENFADSLVLMFGDAVYLNAAALRKDGILRTLQSAPELWALLGPRQPELEKFIDEFLAYGSEEEQTGDQAQRPAA